MVDILTQSIAINAIAIHKKLIGTKIADGIKNIKTKSRSNPRARIVNLNGFRALFSYEYECLIVLMLRWLRPHRPHQMFQVCILRRF